MTLTIDKLHDLLDLHDGFVSFEGICHDCSIPLMVSATALEDGIHIEGGSVYEPYPNKYMIKCNACYKKDNVLKNYQECEVWARVVGFFRPVKDFNKAKKAEFKDRKNFKLKGDI